jgi:hypothetical protein
MSQEDIGSCSKLLNFRNYLIHQSVSNTNSLTRIVSTLRNGPRLVTRAGQGFRADRLRKVSNIEQSDRLPEIYHARSTVGFVRALPHEAKPGQMTVGTRPFPLRKIDRFNSEI